MRFLGVAILLFFFLGQAVSEDVLLDSGTLVIFVHTRDGLVIAADRRTNDSIRHDLDTTEKIRQIGPFTAAATTGQTVADPISFAPIYDPTNIAAEFFADKDLRGSVTQHSKTLAQELGNRMTEMKSSVSFCPDVCDVLPDKGLFALLIFHYNRSASKFEVARLLMLYRNQQAEPPWWQMFEFDEDLENGEPAAYGNVKAYNELKSGTDKRFDAWRRKKAIRKLLGRNAPASRVSKGDALRFVRAMIRASCEILPLIDDSPNHVGPTTDVALISPTKGFSWLYRDSPPKTKSGQAAP